MFKEATKLSLFYELSAIIGKEDLGFDEKSLPEKMCMINVIHSLEPKMHYSRNHKIRFSNFFHIYRLLKELDSWQKKNLCFIRRTKEQGLSK